MIGELTYHELLYSPDLAAAVEALSDEDLCAALERLQDGKEKGWAAERVQGVCILDAARRFTGRFSTFVQSDPVPPSHNSKPEIASRADGKLSDAPLKNPSGCDRCHGSEVPK